jgi:curved DNA-binding protein CbpA
MSHDLLRSYFILDLNPTATLEQVRAAYHDLIKVWHPD